MMSASTPSIIICVPGNFSGSQVLREAARGVEEESIPYEILTQAGEDAASLAYTGAELSVLEVGIGIDDKGFLAVHYRKLPPERPLYLLDYTKDTKDSKNIRTACANAARLVKSTPFKEMKEA